MTKLILQTLCLFAVILLGVACAPSAPDPTITASSTVAVSTPSGPPTAVPTVALMLPNNRFILEHMGMGITKDGQPIVVTGVEIIHNKGDGYDTANKTLVSRGNSLFWLRSSDTPRKYGCNSLPVDSDFTDNVQAEEDRQSYEFFGCYPFGRAQLVDLDKDGEPEIIVGWSHPATSGSYNSAHFYRWDGREYKLVRDIIQHGLDVELRDLNNDGQLEVIVRYNAGDVRTSPAPWVDVYALSNGNLVEVNPQ